MAITAYTEAPYFDDINFPHNGLTPLEKNYLRVLFKPGKSVQARELNQAQTFLQAQLDRLGQSLLKPNNALYGGTPSFNLNLNYIDVIISTENNNVNPNLDDNELDEFLNDVLTNKLNLCVLEQTNGQVNATIEYYETIIDTTVLGTVEEPLKYYRLYFTYKEGTEFNDVILYLNILQTGLSASRIVLSSNISDEVINNIGIAAAAKVAPGFFLVNGSIASIATEQNAYYALAQGIKFNGYSVLEIEEKTINSDLDISLVDNSAGSLNEFSPGADRYQLNLNLKLITNDQFIENENLPLSNSLKKDYVILQKIQNNNVIESNDGNENSRILNDLLATRTYEESGDYVVRPFNIEIQPVINNDFIYETNGRFINTENIINADFEIFENNSELDLTNPTTYNNYYALTLQPSVAYVKGVRVAPPEARTLIGKRARITYSQQNEALNGSSRGSGQFKQVNISASLGNKIKGIIQDGLPQLDAYYQYYNLYNDATPTPDIIGSCQIQSIEKLSNGQVQIYLYNVQINTGESLLNVSHIGAGAEINGGFGTPLFEISIPGVPETYSNINKASALYNLGHSAVKSVKNIKIDEKVSADSVLDGNLQAQFTGFTFDKSESNTLVLVTHNNGIDYIVINDFEIITSTDPNELTISLENSTDDLTNISSGNAIKIIATSQANDLEVGKKKKTTTQLTTVIDSTGASIPILDCAPGEIYKVPNIFHAISINSDSGFQIELTGSESASQYKEAYIRCLSEPSGPVSLTYWHMTGNPIYTVNSYYDENNQSLADQGKMDEIPFFDRINLSNMLDFRINPNNSNRIALDDGSNISVDIDFYLPRRDIVIVNSSEEFKIIEGTPKEIPIDPEIPTDAMGLYRLYIPPYTWKTKEIDVGKIDNRRYTMRDIGELDRRIGILEYYTNLSLLEKSAEDQSIYDEVGERFKNGFIVDGFRNYTVMNLRDSDCICSLDRNEGKLYPYKIPDSISFKLTNAIQIEGNTNYPNSGIGQYQLTLPYKDEEYIVQNMATQFISVQPHEALTKIGSLNLYPETDMWCDTTAEPAVPIDLFGGLNQVITDIAERSVGFTAGIGQEQGLNLLMAQRLDGDVRAELGIPRNQRNNQFINMPNLIGTNATQWEVTNVSGRRGDPGGWRIFDWEREVTVTGLQEEEFEQSLGRYLTDVKIQPYMRARPVFFYAIGLKPNTQLYGFFDGVNVSDYIWRTEYPMSLPLEPVSLGQGIPEFPDTNEYEGFDYETLEIIFDPENPDHINSSPVPAPTVANDLVTDEYGRIQGVFLLPNDPPDNSGFRFAGGEKTLKLTSSPRNKIDEESTAAYAKFISNGLEATSGETRISTRIPRLVETTTTETRQTAVRWRDDPVAQSFRIDNFDRRNEDNPIEVPGIFISKIDIAFAEKPVGSNDSVKLWVCRLSNGIPIREKLAGSEVEVAIGDVNTSADSSAWTSFVFDSPLYLETQTDIDGTPIQKYAFVVYSDNVNYKVYITELGGESRDIQTNTAVINQQAVGVFFTSSNQSTWTPYQNKDMKFRIWRADFPANETKTIEFNPALPETLSFAGVNDPGTNVSANLEFLIPPPDNLTNGIQAVGELIHDPVRNNIAGIQLTTKGRGYTTPVDVVFSTDPGFYDTIPSVTLYPADTIRISSMLFQQDSITHSKSIGINSNTNNISTSLSNTLNLGNISSYQLEKNVPIYPEELIETDNNITLANQNTKTLKTSLTTNHSFLSPVVNRNSTNLLTQEYLVTNNIYTTSKYVSRKFTLNNLANQLDGYLTINRPAAAANVEIFAQLYDIEDNIILNPSHAAAVYPPPNFGNEWFKLSAIEPLKIPINSDRKVYSEVRFNLSFENQESPLGDIQFGSFIIKIALLSDNIRDVPTLKDYRFIATS